LPSTRRRRTSRSTDRSLQFNIPSSITAVKYGRRAFTRGGRL
jgi:hypothetical protein